MVKNSMRLTDLYKNILIESKNDKALIERLYNQWKEENPNLTVENINDIVDKFLSKKSVFEIFKVPPSAKSIGDVNSNSNDLLSINEKFFLEDGFKQEIVTFLSRFDGRHQQGIFQRPDVNKNKPNYKEEYLKQLSLKLKDIRNYTYKQVIFLLSEFDLLDDNTPELEVQMDKFDVNELSPRTPEKRKFYVEESKNLWYTNNKNCIVYQDNIRIYAIKDQFTSIKYGYYLQDIKDKLLQKFPRNGNYGFSRWCVTNESSGSDNYWGSYRNGDKYTFYFVILPDKLENARSLDDAKKYLLAIGAMPNDYYNVTTIQNQGGDTYNKTELLFEYPELNGHVDKLVYVPYDAEKELIGYKKNVTVRINEEVGNEYEFSVIPKELKDKYISEGGLITKPKSWRTMSKQQRIAYVDMTTVNNFYDRFNSLPLLCYIKNDKEDNRYLTRRLDILQIKETPETLSHRILKQSWRLARKSIKYPNMLLYKDLRTTDKNGGFALFDTETMDFLRTNDYQFVPKYFVKPEHVWVGDDGKKYLLELYTLNRDFTPETTSFYCLMPIDNINETGAGGNFFTYKKIKELIESGKIENPKIRGGRGRLKGVDSTTDFDIK